MRSKLLAIILLFSAVPVYAATVALEWDATDDYVYLDGDETDFDVSSTNEISVSAWIKRDSTQDNQMIFSKRDDSDTSNGDTTNYAFAVGTSGVIYVFYSTTTSSSSSFACDTDSAAISDTDWHHVVLTWDPSQSGCSNEFKVYVDGSSVATGNWFGTEADPDTTNELTYVGSIFDGTDGSEVFDGGIAQVAVWKDKVLTGEEATTLYNGGVYYLPDESPWLTSMVGLWEFNGDDTANVYADLSGNSNDMTIALGTNGTGLDEITGPSNEEPPSGRRRVIYVQ